MNICRTLFHYISDREVYGICTPPLGTGDLYPLIFCVPGGFLTLEMFQASENTTSEDLTLKYGAHAQLPRDVSGQREYY